MSADLRLRLSRRAISPVEILFDVTKHWFVMLVLIALGTASMLLWVASEPPIFECAATLALTPKMIPIEGENPRSPPPRDRDPDQVFIGEQLALLTSDSVMEAIARKLCTDPFYREDDSQREDKPLPLKVLEKLQNRLSLLLPNVAKPPQGTPIEFKIQNQKAAFRERSYLLNERHSIIIKIGLFGTSRNRLSDELQLWIDAYRSRIDEISRETYQKLFADRMDYWSKEEKDARLKLQKFQKENPAVNKSRLDLMRESVNRLKLMVELSQRQLASNDPLTSSESLRFPPLGRLLQQPEGETLLTQLKRRKDKLEVEKTSLLAKFTPTNEKVKSVEDEIKALEEQIRKVLETSPQEAEKGSWETVLAAKVKAMTEEINRSLIEQDQLEHQVGELTALTAVHTRALEMTKHYQGLMELRIEQTESLKLVNVQVQDKPTTSVTPVNGKNSLKIALGALSGLVLGVFACFTLELFCPRVRFKRDLETELGIKVIGVIRK
jgi:uncharacterized protein involved in exopolysaccharide biosynthesis